MGKRIRKVLPLLLIGLTFYCVEAGGITQFFDDAALKSRLFNDAHSADLSISFLRILFGSVSTLGGSNRITGLIFRMFNLGLLVVVSVTIGYTVIASVIGSSQDGSGAFSTRVSPWTLFRTVGGVSMMVPINAHGYSVMQTLVMRVVLLGIALANTAWDGALTYLEANSGSIYPQTTPAMVTADEITRAGIAAKYFSDLYENLWQTYDGLCSGQTNCIVNTRVSTVTNTKNLKFILTRQSDSAERCFTHEALLPSSLSSTAGNDTKVQTAMSFAEAYVSSSTRQLMTMVMNNYRTPLFSGTSLPQVSASTPSTWEASHNAWHASWGRTLPTGSTDVATYNRLWLDARLRQTNLSTNIASLGYTYASSMAAVYPAISAAGTSTSSTAWYDVARHRGWLASGMYYSKFLTPDNSNPSSATAMSFGTSYTARTGTSATPITPERDIIVAPAVGASATVRADIPTDSATPLAGRAESRVSSVMPPPPALSGSTPGSFVVNSNSTTLVGFSTAFVNLLRSRPANDPSRTYDRIITDTFMGFDNYLPRFGRGSREAYSMIPHLSGSVANANGTGWMYGVDPAMPISNLAIMLRGVFMQLIGFKGTNGCDIRNESTNTNWAGIQSMSWTYYRVEDYRDGGSKPNCLEPGSLLHTIFYPDANVNVIAMVQSLGRTMVHRSIHYYGTTVEGLYSEVKKLADWHFGVTTAVNVAAAAVEAGTYGTFVAAAGAIASTVAEIANTGFKMGYNGTKVALEIYVPLGTSVAAILFTLGIVLGVYIPMMPFLLFLFGIVAWLMSVIEAMVAAPLVALGVTHPEGHDILGKAEQAMMLMLGVFIRPITMLFGMLMAVVVSQLLLKLFHLGFMQILLSLFAGTAASSGIETQAILLVGSLLIYIYVLINVVEQSFSLVYVIPERILRWVGGPQDQTGISQLADQTKGEIQQASGQAAQGASQSTAAPSMQPTTADIDSPKEDGAEKDGEKNEGGDGDDDGGEKGNGGGADDGKKGGGTDAGKQGGDGGTDAGKQGGGGGPDAGKQGGKGSAGGAGSKPGSAGGSNNGPEGGAPQADDGAGDNNSEDGGGAPDDGGGGAADGAEDGGGGAADSDGAGDGGADD